MEQSAKGTAAFRGRSLRIALATGGALLLVGAGIAAGQGGGVGAPDPPEVDDVLCRQGCLGLRVATVGATVELSGRNLRDVTKVNFKGSDGRVQASPTSARGRRIEVKVPEGAVTGRLAVRDAFGGRSRTAEKLRVRAASPFEGTGDFKVTEASAKPAKGFFDGKRPTRFNYLFTGAEPVDVRIDVVKNGSGKLIDSISERDQEPGAVQSVRWKGLRPNGRVAPDGKYRFLVGPERGGLDDSDGTTKFRHYGHKFPVRARNHDYGDGLGAGRNHMGQDVFARCGTKIVAARGGKVTWRQFQSAAGYYLVIDGKRTNQDYVYMHLAQRGRPKQGARVRTGETIGFMSDTGNATGCHLHFELWKGSWQMGGRVIDPTRPMRRWDRWS